jgi:hypothetical protein
VSFDDFADFKEDEPDALEPTSGNHTATLVRGAINRDRDTDRVKWVILEWQTTDLAFYWTSFHGVTKGAKHFTKRALEELGIDMDAVSGWDEIADALTGAEGVAFTVRVTRNGKYLNTEVIDRPDAIQTELPVEVPHTPKPATDFDDDDVPF